MAAVCDCGTPWTFLLPFFKTIYYRAGNQCYQRNVVSQVNQVIPPVVNRLISVRELRAVAIKHLVELLVEFLATFSLREKLVMNINFKDYVFSDCGTHPTFPNGIITGDTFFGGSVDLSCNRGYLLQGSVICQDNGQWQTDMQCTPTGE